MCMGGRGNSSSRGDLGGQGNLSSKGFMQVAGSNWRVGGDVGSKGAIVGRGSKWPGDMGRRDASAFPPWSILWLESQQAGQACSRLGNS